MSYHPTRAALLVVLAAPFAGAPTPRQAPASASLDAFMSRVLERRDEAWKKLHDYVLSERERFDITGPAGVRLNGMRREFAWYVRDGYLVRSPIKYDGVAIPEPERRKYEENWLKEEKAREQRRAKEAGQSDRPASDAPDVTGEKTGDPSLQDFVGPRAEPRFVSESFFLKFTFEAGNYYLAGRERLDGRDVVRVEYYPTNLFGNRRGERQDRAKRSQKDADLERKIERDLNKVALVTLWIDPAEYQVVRYRFDNVDFGFLPARWLLRVDAMTASMTMTPAIDGVWLPRDMAVEGGLTLATGSYRFAYARELYDYKKAETGAKIRSIGR